MVFDREFLEPDLRYCFDKNLCLDPLKFIELLRFGAVFFEMFITQTIKAFSIMSLKTLACIILIVPLKKKEEEKIN